MRVLKFRAWDLIEKRMWSYEELDASDKDGVVLWGELMSGNDNNFEIMQFVGSPDRDGTDVYAGDIFQWQLGMVEEIVWEDDLNGWNIDKAGLSTGKVIGNKYANPDMYANLKS